MGAFVDFLDKLRIFKRVAESKSFSSVASEFGLTQPTVSKTIQALEQELGLTLFRRSTRGLSITVEGQKLYYGGGPLLDHAEQVIAEVKKEKIELAGEIRVTASLAFARIILAPHLKAFARRHPSVRFRFHLADGFVDLIENEIDVAIRIGKLADSRLKAVRVGTSRRALYASRSYLQEFGKPSSVQELKDHRLLYFTRLSDRPAWPITTTSGETRAFYFEPYFKTDGSDLLREAVLNGMGIGFMPTWMMQDEDKLGVVRLFESMFHSPLPIFAVTTSSRGLSARQRALIDFLRVTLDQIPTVSLRDGVVKP